MKKGLIFIYMLPPLLLGACQQNIAGEDDAIYGHYDSQLKVGGKDFRISKAPFYTDNPSNNYNRYKECDFTFGWFIDTPLTIYTPFKESLNYLFPNQVNEEIKNNQITYKCPDDLTFILDFSNQTITAQNYDQINLFSKKYDTQLGMIDEKTTTYYVDGSASYYVGGEDVVFDLNKYSLNMFKVGNQGYVDFHVVNTITFNYAMWSSVNFNGDGFYYLNMLNGTCGLSYTNNIYNSKFYNSERYKKINVRSYEYFRENNYQSFMFQLDHFYGFRDEKMVPFDDYLNENYPEVVTRLKSDDETTYCQGVEYLINYVIGDGHTNAGNTSSFNGNGRFSRLNVYSDREIQLSNNYYRYSRARSSALGNNFDQVRYSGETAIISFDSFDHYGVKFNEYNAMNYASSDGFSLFYDSFQQIEKHGGINNIIFDITCNGGGDTNALIPMLGFLNRTVKMTVYSSLSKLTAHLSYDIDTNLDGVYDDNDGFQGQYNFYILTSHYSFSCANLFPQTAKEMGIAKIIGEQSGGGACVVYYTATPDGKTYRISSDMRDGDPLNPSHHNDAGIPVDYELDSSYFYDDVYLNNFVTGLSA